MKWFKGMTSQHAVLGSMLITQKEMEEKEGWEDRQGTCFEGFMPASFAFPVRGVWQMQLVAHLVSIHLSPLPMKFQF